jgi:hypothetical protein
VVISPRSAQAAATSRVCARVRDVEGLDAVEAHGDEPLDGVEDLGVGVEVPERVRPHGDPARGVDRLDRLGDRRRRAAAEGRRARDEVGHEEGGEVREAFGGDPVRVGRVVERGFGEMRAADRQARMAACVEGGAVEDEALLLEGGGHAIGAARPILTEPLEPVEEPGVGVVEAVAKDVKVLALAVQRGQLDRGDDAEVRRVRGRVERLLDAVDGVVVGEREQRDTGSRRARDDLRGWERPVRVRRM